MGQRVAGLIEVIGKGSETHRRAVLSHWQREVRRSRKARQLLATRTPYTAEQLALRLLEAARWRAFERQCQYLQSKRAWEL